MELIDIPLRYILAGFFVWIAGFIWLAKRPEWIGISAMTLLLLFPVIVDSLLGGKIIPMGQVMLLFFGPPLLVYLILKRPKVVWLDLLFVGGYTLCILISIVINDRPFWDHKAALNPIIFLLLVYLSIDSQKALNRLLYVFFALVFINTVIAGLQVAGFEWAYPDSHRFRADHGGFARGFGLTGRYTKASLYATIMIPIAVAMFIASRRLRSRLLSLSMGVIGVAAQVLTVTRAGVLGIALGVWIVVKRGIDLRSLATGVVGVTLAVLIVSVVPVTQQAANDLIEHLSVFVTDKPLDDSAASRPELASKGLAVWLEKPVFGGGPHPTDRDPHNTIVNLLASYGIVGTVFFIIIMYRSYRSALRADRMGYRAEGTGLRGALVGTLIFAIFHSLDYYRLFWLVPALCLALSRLPAPQRRNLSNEVVTNSTSRSDPLGGGDEYPAYLSSR